MRSKCRTGAACTIVLALLACALPLQAAAKSRVAFELVTQHGQTFTHREFDGVPVAIFFGFTSCPDICPMTLLHLTEDLEALGADGDKLKVVFVTVDPEHDSAQMLKEYLSSFDPRIVALTGRIEEIDKVVRAYGATYRRVPLADGRYTVDHTVTVFLLDRDGELSSALSWAEPPQARLVKWRRLFD